MKGDWEGGCVPESSFLSSAAHPMIGFIGLGMGSAALYLLRRGPDVW